MIPWDCERESREHIALSLVTARALAGELHVLTPLYGAPFAQGGSPCWGAGRVP